MSPAAEIKTHERRFEMNIERLIEVGNLIQRSIQIIAKKHVVGWECPESILPWDLYEEQRNIISATGVLVELVSDPSLRLMEYSGQYWESRALAIVTARRIPDILDSRQDGVPIDEISQRSGIETRKLARVMRCLCSSHIFQEPKPDTFANNRISAALIGNEPLRAYIQMFHADLFSCAEHLPKTLFDPDWGSSYKVNETAFQSALGTTKTRWQWLEEQPSDRQNGTHRRVGYPGIPGEETSPGSDGKILACRPELSLFSMAMVGGGKVSGAAHIHDYPWGELNNATIVDVGGGVGGFMIELSQRYPKLNFVIQDRGPNIELARDHVWPKERPTLLSEGRVQFMAHDFFEPNPVNGAEIYWLRYILHDWSDSYAVKILSAIRQSMTVTSRILICEQVMDTTADTPGTTSRYPLPPNYGVFKRYSHQRDLDMMAILNGIERTPKQFEDLFREAGLILEKIWACRSQVSILQLKMDTGLSNSLSTVDR